MNLVILLGRIGSDVELKNVGDTQVASFSLATSYKWKDKKSGEMKEKTTWHLCESWGKQAEVMAGYLAKGSKIMLKGEIDNQQYEKDGQKRTISKVRVSEFEFCDSKQSSEKPAQNNPAPADESIPF